MKQSGTLGKVAISPSRDVNAGSYCSWTITITVGKHGIDHGGHIAIARRNVSDMQIPQFDDPAEPGYTTASTTGKAKLRARYTSRGYIRPWRAALIIDVYDGSLAPGDQVIIILGDRSRGSPGLRAQTFSEEEHTFLALVDPFGTGLFREIPDSPRIRIVGGPVDRLRLVAPSYVISGTPFSLGVCAQDSWGNPAPHYEGTIGFETTDPQAALPGRYSFDRSQGGARRFKSIILRQPSKHWITIRDEENRLTATSNPIICERGERGLKLLWGDLHGQTKGTVGTGSVEEYFRFGRDVAFLDFIGHSGNDFQITKEHWAEICREVKRFNQPGEFVTFLGYEWSGLTPAGGDHNIYFLGDDQQIHRSDHWLIEDKSDAESDRYPISELYKSFKGRRDVMSVPHVGGRYGNLDYYDERFSPVVEIHSHHGTFEWLAEDALRRGLRVGFIAGSDDHSGRPGATYPTGASSSGLTAFPVRGGLTAVYSNALTRKSIWEALQRRHCFATTGERIILQLHSGTHMMGDELSTDSPPTLAAEIHGTAPIFDVRLMRGTELLYRYPVLDPEEGGGKKIAIIWSGVRVKSRQRQMKWDGGLTLSDGRIISAEEFAFDLPDQGISRLSNQELQWRSTTSGDPDGVILEVDASEDATIRFTSGPASFTIQLKDVTPTPRVFQGAGINGKVEVSAISTSRGPRSVEFKYTDKSPMIGMNPYYLRVTQADGAMAWSSPIFVEYE